jgi:hypothetical protein
MGSLLSLGCGPVPLFNCVSFAHILALLSRAVKTRALLVINVYLGIDTHTNSCPPPGAGVAVPVLRVTGSAEGDALTELLGLKNHQA